MKIRAFLLAVAATGILLCACGKNTDGVRADKGGPGIGKFPVYGSWSSPRLSGEKEGFKFAMTLRFSEGRMVASNTCTSPDGQSLTAEASARATITGTTIDVLENDAKEEKRGGFSCRASIDKKGLMHYEMPSINALKIRGEGGNPPLELTRVRQID